MLLYIGHYENNEKIYALTSVEYGYKKNDWEIFCTNDETYKFLVDS